ncbi:MAG: TIGR01212 family radical SAM protein [Clostridia bacterium]|nr:TIGR01212 family radical SAM protein [Clostridia bacterium]
MENIFNSTHFYTVSSYLKKEFGCRVMKLSLDAGFTCPNRDGTVGTGGCLFCSEDGAGHYASNIESQVELLKSKWPEGKYIAYFQNHTNTYASTERLRALWEEALAYPNVVGLAVATRPDCLPEDVLNLLSEFNKRTFLWVELGLQTSNEGTARAMNRCYDNSAFKTAMNQLSIREIKAVIHLILGLPGEEKQDMFASADYVASFNPFGLKLHMLHVMKNTGLAKMYPDEFCTFKKEEYIRLVVDILERLPQDLTIHRLTGDAPKEDLIAPLWSIDKRSVLNGIQKEFKRRNSFQGIYYSPKSPLL